MKTKTKTINLWDDVQGWTSFNYENIEDIESELILHKIFIGPRASIGNGAFIKDGAIVIQFIGSKHIIS